MLSADGILDGRPPLEAPKAFLGSAPAAAAPCRRPALKQAGQQRLPPSLRMQP